MKRIRDLGVFYNTVSQLADQLRDAGATGDADTLDQLMNSAWTTGSELLGELALALGPMQGRYSGELRLLVTECYDFATHHRKILGLD
ncbi:MAG: hypothetical protein GY842_27525 [bacterium]|nr:hypothetical protein [bacterium]